MKTNLTTRVLVTDLKKAGKTVKLWRYVAEELEKPTRHMAAVNLKKLDAVVRDGEVALVPGKVLSLGSLSKKMTVAAFQFSEAARAKIVAVHGEALSLKEILKSNPKAKHVRVVK